MYVLIPVYYAASCGEYNPKRDLKIYDRSGEIRIVNAKGGKERTIPLNNIARSIVGPFVKTQNQTL